MDTTLINKSILFENFDYDCFDGYDVLTEASSDINKINDEMSDISSEQSIGDMQKKSSNIVKKILSWWYKEDPNSQAKTFRLVVTLLGKLLSIVLKIYLSKKVIAKFIKPIAASSVDKILPLASDGVQKVSNFFIVGLLANSLNSVVNKFKSISKNIIGNNGIKYNKKDLENSIEKFSAIIKSTNDAIDKMRDAAKSVESEDEKKIIKSHVRQLVQCKLVCTKSLYTLTNVKNTLEKEADAND